MEKVRLQRLLRQYLDNSISEDDCIWLLNYLAKAEIEDISDEVILDLIDLDNGPSFKGEQAREILNRIHSDERFKQATPVKPAKIRNLSKLYLQRWLQVAAAVFILFLAGLLFVLNPGHTPLNQLAKSNKPSGPSLTLANGSVVYLQSANNGLLAKTGAGNVVKIHNGQILYSLKSNSNTGNKQIGYNTLTTPNGSTYQVVLPDGTNVWLNAASSITYPTAFNGKTRNVKLDGEAYFEVAKDKHKPFYVAVNNVSVRVLGTHFNIAAYKDDNSITTTLLEGSVQVTKNSSTSLLKPGQQAVINNSTDQIIVSAANVKYAMAWKNGYFIFDDDNITGIMKKVSRWYDVSVSYQGKVSDQKFGGTYYRSKSITELLQYLEKIGKVRFTVEGRRIIVM